MYRAAFGGNSLTDKLVQSTGLTDKFQDGTKNFSGTGKPSGFASGGPVYGSGNSRSDSINARLSNGEYVINARDAARNRSTLDSINSGGSGGMNVTNVFNMAPGLVAEHQGSQTIGKEQIESWYIDSARHGLIGRFDRDERDVRVRVG